MVSPSTGRISLHNHRHNVVNSLLQSWGNCGFQPYQQLIEIGTDKGRWFDGLNAGRWRRCFLNDHFFGGLLWFDGLHIRVARKFAAFDVQEFGEIDRLFVATRPALVRIMEVRNTGMVAALCEQ